tara:strand:- start:1338 stop:2189 length:852 start_codon:yes stop_codon:yes gene_type:complete
LEINLRNPKRILEKIIGISHDFDRLEQTGESFEQLVEVLRDVMKCRLTRQWINNNYGFDIFVSPETFTLLLDIPQINFIENSNRTMELDTISLKKMRKLGDPVTVGNLNALLRELYRNLESIQGRLQNDYPNPLLINAMRSDLIGLVTEQIESIKMLNGRLTGYILNLGKVKAIENSFKGLFPDSVNIDLLRKIWPIVEREMEFYRKCSEMNERWEAIGIDLFQVLRKGGLPNLRENIQEMGNLLWKIVYNQKSVEQCLKIMGIDFTDARTVLDSNLLKLNNV